MRTAVAAGLVALAVGLTGCTARGGGTDGHASARAAQATARWSATGAPDHYSYVLESRCGERALIGTFRVTVTGGVVTSLEGVDQAGTLAATSLKDLEDQVPTIDGLLRRIQDESSHVTEVGFDERTGAPTHVTFDPMPSAVDDEECYTLTDVRTAV